MASEEVFSLDGIQQDIRATVKAIEDMEKAAGGEFINETMLDAGKILSDEQKRILSQREKYAKLSEFITVKTKKEKGTWTVMCGYQTEAIQQHFEVLIIEFGRPGKKGAIDKRGHKIGVIQPYPHIRAAMFTKGEALKRYIADRVFEKLNSIWEGKENG